MDKEQKIKVGIWTSFIAKVNFKKIIIANKALKLASCFMILIISLTLMALVADTWNFWDKNDIVYISQRDGSREVNPHFKWVLSSLILFVISAILCLLIIYKTLTNKNLDNYKFIIFPLLILMIGFFLTFKPLNEFGILNEMKQLSGTPDGWTPRYAHLGKHMLITLSAIGITYFTTIGAIILLERFIKNNYDA